MNYPLKIQIVPATGWNLNLKQLLKRKTWRSLMKSIRSEQSNHCSICGDFHRRLKIHLVWKFDDRKKNQVLKEVVGMCPPCYQATHMTKAYAAGYGDYAVIHFMGVNGISSRQEYHDYLNKKMVTYEKRSHEEWNLDYTWLKLKYLQAYEELEKSDKIN